MAELPGNLGHGVLGDKSMEFYRDPVAFINRHVEQHKSRIFLTRFLMKPTVILASNDATLELLNNKENNFEMGYKDLFSDLYGDNVLFLNGEDAIATRSVIKPFLCQHSGEKHSSIVEGLIHHWLDSLNVAEPVAVYAEFKSLAINLSLAMFLGVDHRTSHVLAQEIAALITTHWHGIVSLPVNAKVPSFMSASHKKAIAAKEKLVSIIERQLSNRKDLNVPDEDTMSTYVNHVLLAVSSLVPKAIASYLTSFVTSSRLWYKDYTNKQGDLLEEELDNLLLEIERCWPPFVGGRRLAVKDCQLSGFHVPAGHAILYVSFAAHRDPGVFPDPDTFQPERWKTYNSPHRDRLFSFGNGPRNCVATQLVSNVIKFICCRLVERFYWEPTSLISSDIKWFPITRPKQDLTIRFTAKIPR